MIAKKIATSILLLFMMLVGYAQDHTDADMTVNRFQTLYNTKQYEQVFDLLSERMKKIMPQEQTGQMMGKLYEQYGEMKSYTFQKQVDKANYYKTSFSSGFLSLIVSLNDDKKVEAFRFLPWKDENIAPGEKSDFVYKTPTGNIYGSFSVPDGDKAVPVVLIVAGSGPTDRNGNQDAVSSSTYKMIADSLRVAGIASLRYDKRGVGESAAALKDESSMRFEDMVNDAAGIIAMLKADKRFSSVIVMGHSEGSLVGMMAAAKEPVNGYISVAGLANSADKILVRQIAAQSEELSMKAAFILDSLLRGKKVDDPGPELATLFRPSVQPYLMSWIKYNPQDEIKKLSVPVLIVQGTTDIQVSEGEAITLKEAYPKATLKIIKGMNHVLKTAPEDRAKNTATYSMPTLPLAPGFIPSIVAFVGFVMKG